MIELDFDKLSGLIPVIVQEHETGEVLMMAYMNRHALDETVRTGFAHYWSRSRKRIWKKGEVSGNVQEVKEVRVDCDSDCLLIKVRQEGGAACHTGYRSCFHRIVRDGKTVIDGRKVFDPKDRYPKDIYPVE